jgi:hypothetical protein
MAKIQLHLNVIMNGRCIISWYYWEYSDLAIIIGACLGEKLKQA